MSLKFGNHLFRNRKDLPPEDPHSSTDDLAQFFGELPEKVIVLCKEDIRADSPKAPLLEWPKVEKGKIAVQLKDTEGFSDGSVVIKASRLQQIYPELLPAPLDSEYLFPISLQSVVLQVQAHLQQGFGERPKPIGPDFDTPIAQVAREDEGFFKIEKIAEPDEMPIGEIAQAKRNLSQPVLTPADRPASWILRKKSPTECREPGSFLRSDAMVVARQQQADLETEVRRTACAGAKIGATAQSPLRRAGLERLRELFMTEDQLDASQVANLLAGFPKVRSALVMLGDGTVLGGYLPEGFNLDAARLTPVIMQSVREFNRRLRSSEISACTLVGDLLVSLFAEGNIYILISHEGRGLLPGLREKMREVARALDALCCGTTDHAPLDG